MEDKTWNIKLINRIKFDYYSVYFFIHTETYNKKEFLFLTKKINKIKKSVLVDIGSGLSIITELFSYKIPYVVGMDISSKVLLTAKRRLEANKKTNNIDFIIADIEFLPFRKNSLDIISMYSVLHHLPNLEKAIKEFSTSLKKEGIIICFHEPNYHVYKKSYNFFMKKTFLKKILSVFMFLYLYYYLRKKRPIIYKRIFMEKLLRKKYLGESEELADIYDSIGFDEFYIKKIMSKYGIFTDVKYRTQDFSKTFGGYKNFLQYFAFLDDIFSFLLNKNLPVILLEGKKVED